MTFEPRATSKSERDVEYKELCQNLDLSSRDNHMKYERKYFAVVGEGTRSALTNYLTNYDLIQWDEYVNVLQNSWKRQRNIGKVLAKTRSG